MRTKNGFSLVEILLTMTLIGVMAVGFLPMLTKRAKGNNNPDCLNGFKNVKKIYKISGTFTVPEGIASDVAVTIIDGGQGGTSGNYQSGIITNGSSCSLPDLENNQFYTNVSLSAVEDGKSADCTGSTPKAGGSGESLANYKIDTTRCQYVYNVAQKTLTAPNNCGSISLAGFTASQPGDKASSSNRILYGGIPPVNIFVNNSRAGVGESCKRDNTTDNYSNQSDQTQGACQMNYRVAQMGTGGAAGNYAKFDLSLKFGDSCFLTVGRGGASGALGERSSMNCNGENLYSTNSDNIPQNNIHNGSEGNLPSNESGISGGSGGSSMKGENAVYSEGAKGGCFGATKSSECSNPNGENGTFGSGGGGGSCNENACGIGGFGGDGLIVIEYREQCQ